MDIAAAGQAVAFWTGLHLLLLLVLSVLAVRQRRRLRIPLGDQGAPELTRAVRAFGNASEYIPAALIAILALAVAGAPAGLVHLTGGALFVGRTIHAVGISRSGGASAPRALGVVLTWLAYLCIAVALLFYAIP